MNDPLIFLFMHILLPMTLRHGRRLPTHRFACLTGCRLRLDCHVPLASGIQLHGRLSGSRLNDRIRYSGLTLRDLAEEDSSNH